MFGGLFWLVCIFVVVTQVAPVGFYRAAIVTMENRTMIPEVIHYVRDARDVGAEIVVYPELGVIDWPEKVRNGSNPCEEGMEGVLPSQYAASCAARDNSIYVAIDIVEKGDHCKWLEDPECYFGFYIYNTAIVFDRKGEVIAKYQKSNIMEASYFAKGDGKPVYFDTDFGIRFGLFICFEILYESPSSVLVNELGITDIVFPTDWYDFLPITSKQLQQGWSEFYQVNFLASNDLKTKLVYESSGSGIYHKGKAIAHTSEVGLIWGDVPIIKTIEDFPKKDPVIIESKVVKTDRNDFPYINKTYVFKAVPGLEEKISLNIEGVLDCSISLRISDKKIDKVNYFMALSSQDYFKDMVKMHVCGIISCGEELKNCDPPKFWNKYSNVYFDSISVETKFYDDQLRMVEALMGANEKELFEDGSFDIQHDNESKTHRITSTGDSIDQPLLEVFNFGVLHDREVKPNG